MLGLVSFELESRFVFIPEAAELALVMAEFFLAFLAGHTRVRFVRKTLGMAVYRYFPTDEKH